MNEKNILLRKVRLFTILTDTEIDVLAGFCQIKNYGKNQMILLENDTANQSLFIISQGSVKVYISGLDGKEAILAMLKEGDYFGEMSMIDEEPRSASVKTYESTTLIVLNREDFLVAIKRNPEMIMTLLKEMSYRIRKANKQIMSLALMTVYGRIAATLIKLKAEKGYSKKVGDGETVFVINPLPSQQHLADMAGTSRETISRALKYFQKKGIIIHQGKELVILKEEELSGA